MRVALTGSSGFIGSYVLRDLHARGIDVIATSRSEDRFPTETEANQRVVMDLTSPPDNPFKSLGKPDVLIHLAWGGLPNYQSRHHVEAELPAQTAFLTSCVNHGLKRLVVTGTCYEYGLTPGELTEATPARPCTEYGTAKDLLRQKLFSLQQQFGFDLAWLRLFYLYGKGQSQRSLYSMLHAAIERGDKTFDMSGGEQIRDFLPVHEAARLIVEIALLQKPSGVCNLCSGVPVPVKQLVQSLIDAAGSKIIMNLGRLPYSLNEPMAFWGNRQRLDSFLGNRA
ncbi:MAG: NAD-dependent epimerase/dehydratase family protein [Rhodanobacteraceae bacterium]